MVVLTLIACQSSPDAVHRHRGGDPALPVTSLPGTGTEPTHPGSTGPGASRSPLGPGGPWATSGATPPPVLLADVQVDVLSGVFPLVVDFDGSASELASGDVTIDWDFGDGGSDSGLVPSHTYIGAGLFDATLTLTDNVSGEISIASTTIDVQYPTCPVSAASVLWGHIDDAALNELSGIAPSRIADDVYWVHEDSGNSTSITAVNIWGNTLGTYSLPPMSDFEDISIQVDPETGVSMMFLGDIGNNNHDRGSLAIYVVEEPDPYGSGDLDPLRMGFSYPGTSRDSEALLVDPLTMDIYLISKEYSGPSNAFVKRAPHDSEGPFVLEDLGQLAFEITATGGDVSADGTRVVLRDYSPTAHLWIRDAYHPLEDVFAEQPCSVGIHSEPQGEAVAFTTDGAGIVTVSEGTQQPLYYIGL
ncbi:MAG: PKD domain-containing protein [Myxococcota bacterium]